MDDAELKNIANDLNGLEAQPNAYLRYDLMSDALVWSDELPATRTVRELWCLRPLFRYRSSLIEGIPDENWRVIWENARGLFPHWCGFKADRSDSRWASELAERRAESKRESLL